jgi:riboflavin kinase / FMN adenylyltransferase
VLVKRSLTAADGPVALTIGNFDGVHRGHQRVISLAAEAARGLGAPLGVITLDPHPRVYHRPDEPNFRLMKRDQQARALEALGVDILYVLPYAELADITDRQFAEQVLHDGLGVRHVSLGFDNSFGKDRTGTPETMAQYGRELGFGVSVAQEVTDRDGEKFSSTSIREALRDGHPEEAARILGRPFAIEGEVVRGRQLGRKLGYPTANVALVDYVVPKFGVYATRTRLPDGRKLPGAANIGVNPTVDGITEPLLEVWLFDFDEDIYDQVIETDLVAFIRPEAKFGSLDEMVAQIDKDAQEARRILGG